MSGGLSGHDWFERARRSIPGGVPGFHRLFPPADPVFLARGHGAWVYDSEGRPYVDFVLGKGPVILGHGREEVVEAVVRAVRDAPLLGLASPVAIEAAEAVLKFFPAGSRVRFHKSGSEACAGAVRMARAYTGRTRILSSGYHGWHDWCSPEAPGALASGGFSDFGYDLARLRALIDSYGDEVAAVFVEPQPGFLTKFFYQAAAEAAREVGALFLLDEVKSAFRVGGFTVGSELGLEPDLVVLGKAISNGFCVSCTVGPEWLMALSDRLHVGTTYDFETGPLAAICATLPILRDEEAPAALCARAESLAALLNDVFRAHDTAAKAFATGAGFRIGFLCPEQETAFYAAAWKGGVLLYPFDNQFLSTAHGQAEIDHLVTVADEALAAGPRAGSGVAWADVTARHLNGLPNRKGFLTAAPGPEGLPLPLANTQPGPRYDTE